MPPQRGHPNLRVLLPDGASYREWIVSPPGGPAGVALWARTVATQGPAATAPSRILPDGCIDLIRTTSGLLVAGPDTSAHVVPPAPGTSYVGLRLPPGVGPVVLGVPGHELRDRRLPLGDVWGAREAGRLERRLAGADVATVGAVLEAEVARRFRAALEGEAAAAVRPDPTTEQLVALLRRGSGVAAAADALGVGARRLHRRSLVAFGYGPRTLGRILRLTRALDLARAGVPPARVAADAGFADQPHLAREVRALTGVALGRLLAK